MSTIETAGALRPGTTNTPLDQRSRVATLAEIPVLSLPYLGQIVYCVETDRYYKVTALKSAQIGALTVADAAVDSYEELPVTTAELQSLIVTQVTNNPTILTFLEELIAARIAESGGTDTPAEELPYTYPEGVTTERIMITMPEEKYFTSDPQNYDPASYIWSDDDTLYVEVYLGDVPVHTEYVYADPTTSYFYGDHERVYFDSSYSGDRIGVEIEGGVKGILTVYFKRSDGTIQKEETVNFTGFHIPKYYTRPSGLGMWQLEYRVSGDDYQTAEAEYWDGGSWVDFPTDGLGPEAAGRYYRLKNFEASSNYRLLRWSNNDVPGDPFLYIE